jgi:predicted DNA-binding ribbon-helix-helix protein
LQKYFKKEFHSLSATGAPASYRLRPFFFLDFLLFWIRHDTKS